VRRFEGRAAVVTGGAGGIGRVVARELAQAGAAVAVADLDGDAARLVAAALPGAALGLEMDAADPDSVELGFAAVDARLGRLDVLINLAGGSMETPRDLPEIAVEDFDLVLAGNLRGTFLCCQRAVPRMAAGGGGSIVNVSSIGGRSASPVTGVPYAAAKAGILGLSRRLAREVGPLGIRVNTVAPGLFLSGPRLQGMWERMSEAEREEVLSAIPLARMPTMEEAARPILFLASDDASYVTGAVLDVNGGRFMSP
jgi:NAD(P)-dependent dehydrogenase (short-subunit alcohol dehydrogenase family)